MAVKTPLSAAPTGNGNKTPTYHTAANTAFTLGTNLEVFHVSAGQDEIILEVCNVDTAAHQLIGAFHQGAIVSPDDLFYQTIAPQSGWQRIIAGDFMPSGLALAFGAYQSSELSKLNIRGFVNRIDENDTRKIGLSAAGTYNKNIKIAGTVAGSATTIHTAITGTTQVDEVYVQFTNTSTTAVLATLCVGGITTVCQTPITVPPRSGWMLALAGENLNNGLVVSAFADTANVINARGWVNRVG